MKTEMLSRIERKLDLIMSELGLTTVDDVKSETLRADPVETFSIGQLTKKEIVKNYYTISQAEIITGRGRGWLQKERELGTLPFVMIGSRYLFLKLRIHELLTKES